MTTPANDYEGTLTTIALLVSQLRQEHSIAPDVPVGIGIPGTISPHSGLVKNANSTCLIGKQLDADLTRILACPVRLANDADCFTISEAIDGAGAGQQAVFGVILGTGVGGGLAIDRKLWVGPNAITGEWGHNPLPWPHDGTNAPIAEDERPGPSCYCGKQGCIETFLSGPGLKADVIRAGGPACDPPEILDAYSRGETWAGTALDRYEHRLARALASVINIIDPGIIVLGGGLSNIERLYARVPTLWDDWVFSDRCDTVLAKNLHGDSSGVRGAAWLWP
ncbi:MAG: ROK family protein [Rhodospirillaceae bacterium]|nr:ROK family protein [Rhodospirillaceae bacterium]